jgi:hypothetical protein
MSRENFGVAKHGGSGGYKNFKLQPGSNLFRIGPPYKSLAAAGKWFSYTKQHFGYHGVGDEQRPKGRIRTFICPEEIDRNTEMVKVECPECTKNKGFQIQVETRTAQYRTEGKKDEQIDILLGPLKGWLKEHNIDKKYLVLAKNENSEWGVLALPYKAKVDLDRVIKTCRAEDGFDPLDSEAGCWINFVRSGEGYQTTYAANPAYEIVMVDGKRAKSIKMDTLTDADFDQISASCPDLTTVGRRLSYEQISQLVECNGDPDEVDAIFNSGVKVEKSPSAVAPAKTANQVVKVKQEENVASFVRVEDPAETVRPVVADDEEAKLLAALAAVRARAASMARAGSTTWTTSKVSEVGPAPKVGALKDMSDDEFFKFYPGVKAKTEG